MTLLAIAGKDVLLLIRDRKALLTLIGTPLILTFILGMAFSAMWSSGLPPSLILWSNGDPGGYGDLLFADVLTMDGIREWIELQEVTCRDDALGRLRRGEATAYIEIPEGFSASILSGEADLSVAGDPASSIRAGIITQIVTRFAAELSSRAVIHATLGDLGIPLPPDQVEKALSAVRLYIRVADGYERQSQDDVPVPMDYYAAGMGVMYLLFTVSHGAVTFLRERETGTLARMYQSPARPWQIAAGKFAGILAIAVLQMTAVIIVSTLVFGVYWGDVAGLALLTGCAAFSASGVGLLIAAVSRSQATASALGTAVVLPMAVLGGSTVPLFAMPPLVRTLSLLTVNGWAMDGYVRLMFEGAGPLDLSTHALVLLASGLGLVAAASTVLARKGVTP